MTKILTSESLGIENKKTIIELLRNEGPLSRADISRHLSLSFPSVSNNVNYLIENKYIHEIGEGNNIMGRKSTLLKLNAKRGYVIGIDLGRSYIRLKISDLLGNSLVTLSDKVEDKSDDKKIAKQLNNLVNKAIKKSGVNFNDIMCLGIGTPGVLNKKTNRIDLIPYTTGWSSINITEGLTEIFNCPVVIENSVNLGAIAEMWRGCGTDYRNFIYLNYSIGIGSALILNRNLFTGSGAAGEIAYTAVSPEFILEKYSDEGSLEQLISGKSIDMEIENSELGVSSLKELFSLDTPGAIRKREEILTRIQKYLGVILINISSLINPEAIILSGGIGINVGRILIPEWKKMMESNIPFIPDLVCSELGSEANVYGAVRFALENIEDFFCSWA
ncbi:MAG: ROK family protein [Clostridiales bacterium]|nr:ROK family protein [Clostridiales bacterium]